MEDSIIILRNIGGHESSLEMPRLTEEVDDRLNVGIDLMLGGKQRQAQDIFRQLIEEFQITFDDNHYHQTQDFERERIETLPLD